MYLEEVPISIQVRNIYLDIIDSFEKQKDVKIVISYIGCFSKDLANTLSEKLESILLNDDLKYQMIKRFFSIVLEGLQNIRRHGERDEKGDLLGFFIVIRRKDKYEFLFGNLFNAKEEKDLKYKLDQVNSIGEVEIVDEIKTRLEKNQFSSKGGAGLGLLVMRRKSKSILKYDIYNLTANQKLLVLSIEVKTS